MSTATANHRRTHKPTWPVDSPEGGYRRLGITMLVDAQTNIDHAIALYKEFSDYYRRFRRAVEWMYAMYDETEECQCVMPFDDVCESVRRDPDAMREKMLDKVPILLRDMIFRAKNSTCPFCEKKK
jgi:hypothetical protein